MNLNVGVMFTQTGLRPFPLSEQDEQVKREISRGYIMAMEISLFPPSFTFQRLPADCLRSNECIIMSCKSFQLCYVMLCCGHFHIISKPCSRFIERWNGSRALDLNTVITQKKQHREKYISH